MFTIDLRVILLMIVATGIYALLLKFLQKNSPHSVQTKGGGGQRPFEQCSKKLHFSYAMASLRRRSCYAGGAKRETIKSWQIEIQRPASLFLAVTTIQSDKNLIS